MYRLVVGEVGNEMGHCIDCRAKSIEGARKSLRRELAKYQGDGWGKICDVIGQPGNRQYPVIERHGRFNY